MYQIGDMVLYGMEGVCEITGKEHRATAGVEGDYYVLKPVENGQSTVWVPAGNPQLVHKMRKLLSAQEVYQLIHKMASQPVMPWEDNDRARRDHFQEILRSGDRISLISMIRTLYLHQQELAAKGKKIHLSDEKQMKEAEKQLHEEFAHVLHIDRDQVVPFIVREIESQQQQM